MKYSKLFVFCMTICLFILTITYIIDHKSFTDASSVQNANDIQNQEDELQNYYRVFEIEPTNNRNYEYQLINKEGHVVFEDTTFRLPPSFSFIDDKIIKIHIGAGPDVFSDRFFDISNNMVSEPFYAPYMTHKKMVVSILYIPDKANTYFIIQDMFNKNKNYLYEKIDIENTSFPHNSIMNLRFLSNYIVWLKYESSDGSIKSKLYFLSN